MMDYPLRSFLTVLSGTSTSQRQPEKLEGSVEIIGNTYETSRLESRFHT